MTRRMYAEDTKVPVEKSRVEIERLLSHYGAGSFMYSQQPKGYVLAFELRDRIMRFVLHRNVAPSETRGRKTAEERAAQENRRRWRALVLILKAKLEAVHSGIVTMEEEFLPYMQMKDGRTVAEWAVTEIQPALEAGTMPRGLLGPGGSS